MTQEWYHLKIIIGSRQTFDPRQEGSGQRRIGAYIDLRYKRRIAVIQEGLELKKSPFEGNFANITILAWTEFELELDGALAAIDSY